MLVIQLAGLKGHDWLPGRPEQLDAVLLLNFEEVIAKRLFV